ncbi:MAG: glucose 1-dehydrogenase [Rhodothermia bacterium]|nr:MAG: glucose 1-dehydrogenase [Rhodothermia bacterium]
MNLDLQNKVAIVTGASRGIGRGIAHSLADEGCKLVICARGEETLEEAAVEFRSLGTDVTPVALDVTTPSAGSTLADVAVDTYGGIDIFVGNVGGNRRKPFEETTNEDWATVLDLNLNTHVRCARAVIPEIRKRGQGSIVFVSSIFGREAGGPGLSIYSATKSALISMAKIMALELGSDGIRVNTVAPGSIRFPGGSWDKRCLEDPEEMAVFIEGNLPMGRFGTVKEVADVVAFLASPRASWISGACLNVDGVQSKSLI